MRSPGLVATQTTVRSNLPTPVSSFIGRQAELAEVRALVAGSRLVTLTGAGGAGKTRLGLQVAAARPRPRPPRARTGQAWAGCWPGAGGRRARSRKAAEVLRRNETLRRNSGRGATTSLRPF
jgi:hypothetical protein